MVHGWAPGRRGDQDQLPGETGPFERHLERLEAADRTADHSAGVRDAEVVRQQQVRPRHVADGYRREGAVIGLSRGGVGARGSRGAVARADDVRADREPARRVEELARFDRVRPPVGYLGVGRQRVADPQGVVAREGTVGVVGDPQRNRRAAFEPERPAGVKYRTSAGRGMVCSGIVSGSVVSGWSDIALCGRAVGSPGRLSFRDRRRNVCRTRIIPPLTAGEDSGGTVGAGEPADVPAFGYRRRIMVGSWSGTLPGAETCLSG